MIHILLIILKIIGIILLSFLGLAVLLILTVLFVPVRYRIDADVHSRFNGKLLMSWLGRGARLEAVYDKDGLRYIFRFLWFTILTSEEDEVVGTSHEKAHRKPKKNRNKKKGRGVNAGPAEPETKTAEPKEEFKEKTEVKAAEPDAEESEVLQESLEAENVSAPDGRLHRIRRMSEKLKAIPAGIKRIAANASEFRDKAGDKLEKFDEIIHDEANREFVRFMKKELGGLFTHIAPVRYNIDIRFGADSPDITGKVTGAAAVIMAFFIKGSTGHSKKNSFEYVPVFTDRVFEADVFMKGRIMPGRVLLTAWRVYRNERFGQLVLKRK